MDAVEKIGFAQILSTKCFYYYPINNSGSSELSSGAIAGIVIGSVFFVILAIVAVVLVRRYLHKD